MHSSGDKPYQVLASATGIYYISTHATKLSGLKIRVTVLDSVTGRKLDQYNLASENDFSETNSIIFAGANSAAPIIAWTDKAKKTFKLTILGDKKIAEYPIDAPAGETVTEINVHAPHRSNTVLRFLVHFATEKSHWASIYEINLVKKAVANVQNLPKAKGKAAYSISHIDANLFFTKITSSEMTVFSSTADAQTLGKWAIQSFSIPGLAAGKEEVYPLHTTAEVVVRDGSASAIRAAVLLSTGDWALVRNGEISWNRPEALAGATAAVWTEFDDAQDLADQLQAESHSNFVSAYIHRVLRHIGDLQHAPAWLQALPNRIIQSVLGLDTGADEKNSFGFAKRVVVATEKGRLIALDSGKAGNVLWNTQLTGLDQADLSAPLELTLDTEAKEILVRAKGKEEQIRVEAKTGAVLGSKPIDLSVSAGTVHYLVVDGELRGYLADKSKEPIWRFAPSSGKKIVSVTARPAEDPIASIGKVLGDRRVLYKYLNPNLIVVSAVSERGGAASFYLLDSVSGKLLYEQTHKNVDTTEPITAEISENWFAYSFTTARTDATSEAPESHGIYLVIAELFESSIPNDRGPLGATANYSSLDLPEGVTPHVESQTYIIPEEISSMAVTHTRQGIASRLLLAVLPDSHSVVGIPRAVLDPRRPVGRDPNANEQAEGLARYTPSIEFDPKWYLNHKREVFGVQKVITSPAYLESTSLVFAFGLDVFGTRVAPSFAFDVLGKGFNKLQMLATVAALWAGVLFVAPLVSFFSFFLFFAFLILAFLPFFISLLGFWSTPLPPPGLFCFRNFTTL